MKYKKTKGRSKGEGDLYEVRIAALIFLRCKASTKISKFQLASSCEVATPLDDIVLRYKLKDEENWRTCFLQLKTKGRKVSDDVLQGTTKSFCITKHLKAFLNIKKEMMSDNEKEELFNGSFEDCQFVMYTNATAHGELSKRTEDDPLGEIETLLKSKSESTAILGFKEERDRDFFSRFEENAREFVQKIKVFTGQPTKVELKPLIIEEIRLKGDVPEKDIDMLQEYYEAAFTEWWRDCDDILDESIESDIYVRALKKLHMFLTINLSSQEIKRACFGIQFKDFKLYENNVCESVSLLHVITSERSLQLSCTRLLQFMEADAYIFLSLECLLIEQNTVVPAWSQGDQHWLVILSKSSDDCRELCDKICEILQENKEKRITVISQKSDSFTTYLKTKLCSNYKEIEDGCGISQLEEASILELMEMKICFQGHIIGLKSFFNKNEQLPEDIVIDDPLIDCLTSDKTLAIGRAFSDDDSYYIPRTLQNYNVLHNEVLNAALKGVLAVSDITLQELQRMIPAGESVCLADEAHDSSCKFVLLNVDAESGYRDLCKARKIVHWVGMEQNRLVWKASHGVIDEIRPHIDQSCCFQYSTENCFSVNQRSVLLVGEPGMGKTTLISHLAKQTKEFDPSIWVMRINLSEHTNSLKKTLCKDPIEFLVSVFGLEETSFEESLLKHSIKKVGNIVVLLDGFDEIPLAHQEKGCRLVAGLLKTKVMKIWVTSRNFIKETVENEMSTLAMTLKEFSKENQMVFLAKFWRGKIKSCTQSDSELKDLITKLLYIVSHSLNDYEKDLTGIPLQTMMLAEVFSEYAANPNQTQLPEKLNLLYLFEEFVKKEYMIYITRKCSYTSMNVDDILEEIWPDFIEKHMNASLVFLIPPEYLEKFHSKAEIIKNADDFVSRVLSGNYKTGIVDSVVHGRPNFKHRCFAEFFAAQWFSKNYELNRDFVREYLLSGRLNVICQMFNTLLARDKPLHEAVLCNDMDRVKELLRNGTYEVNSTDDAGRSALHLAASYNFDFIGKGASFPQDLISDLNSYSNTRFVSHKHHHMVDLLIENGASVNMVDSVLQWTPFQYAVQAKAWDAAEILLIKNSNPNDFIFPEDPSTLWASIIDQGHVALMECVLGHGVFIGDCAENSFLVRRIIVTGHVDLVKLLVTKSEDILSRATDVLRTLLHEAARCGQKEIVKIFIDILNKDIGKIGCAECINIQDKSGNTAMHLACLNGHRDVVELLLESGGDRKLLEKDYKHFLYSVSSHGHLSIVKDIIDSLGEDSALIKKYIDSQGPGGGSSVSAASLSGHSDILALLVENGGDVTIPDDIGVTALHSAIEHSNLSDVKLLIGALEDDRDSLIRYVNSTYHGGMTPMHCVTCIQYNSTRDRQDLFNEQAKIAEFLISKGGNIKLVDVNGCTPLHWAAERCACLPVVKVLLESFHDDRDAVISYINTRDFQGRTAKDCAQGENIYHSLFSTREQRKQVADLLDRFLEMSCNEGH